MRIAARVIQLIAVALMQTAFNSATAADGSLQLHETDATITISDVSGSILVYNKKSPPVPGDVDPIYARSGFLHPVHTPSGDVVTALFPRDHAHQNGVFSAWVNTAWNGRKVDFWNVANKSGRVIHDRVVGRHSDETSAGFEVDLLHQAVSKESTTDILRERWEISVLRTEGSHRCFDLQTTQTALTDKPLTVKEYRYGGIALRGVSSWLLPKSEGEPNPGGLQIKTGFLNDQGSDRIEGNHQKARWVSLYGPINGKMVSVSVLSHPNNFRAPQTARLHPTKPYFCFAPCVEGKFVIDKDHPFSGQYRYLVTDEAPDADWLNDQWNSWTATK